MANPFLVLGGIAVGIITASFGILQVPGWVASAQDASAINDLSMIAAAQAASASQKGAYAGEFDQLTDGHLGLSFTVPDERVQHFTANADGWCSVVVSDSGRYFAASDTTVFTVGADTAEDARAHACESVPLAPGESEPPASEAGPALSPAADIAVGMNASDVAFSPDGTTAYVSNHSMTGFSVVDVASGASQRVSTATFTSAVDVSPDGKFVAVAGSNVVRIYDTTNLALVKGLSAYRATDLAWSEDSTRLTYAGESNFVKFIDTETWAVTQTNYYSGFLNTSKLVKMPGDKVLVTGSKSRVVDTRTGAISTQNLGLIAAAVSAGSDDVWIVRSGELLRIDTTSGATLSAASVPLNAAQAIASSGDGRWLYLLDMGQVVVFDTVEGRVVTQIPMVSGSVASVHASPDGSCVYVARGTGYNIVTPLT